MPPSDDVQARAVEAAARAMYAHEHQFLGTTFRWEACGQGERDYWTRHAAVAYAAIAPIIRAQVAEEIARRIDQQATTMDDAHRLCCAQQLGGLAAEVRAALVGRTPTTDTEGARDGQA